MTYDFTYRKIAGALALSLQPDPFYQILERRASDSGLDGREAMLRYFDYSMLEGLRYGELVIPEGREVGASVWSKPVDEALSARISREKQDFLTKNLGNSCLEAYTDMTGYMSRQSQPMVPDDCWYLSIAGIDPAFQGRGLGGELLSPVLARADAAEAPIFLETFTPRNLRFYRRWNFREAASFVEPVTGAEYIIMLREPGAR